MLWGDFVGLEKLYIELTDKCNLNCKMCYRRSWSEIPRDMDIEILRRIYDEVRDKNLKEVILGGIGEPTFSHLIYDAINLFSNFNLTITTNGTILNEKLKELIVDYVDKLVVSIDGFEDKYEDIRGFNLNSVVNNIKDINNLKTKRKKEKPYIVIQFVATKDNIDDIFKVLDLANELNAFQIIISNVIPQTDDYKDKILYTKYENNEMKTLFERLRIYSFRRGLNLMLPNVELKTERYCPFIEENAIVIGADGGVYPCYRFSHSINEYIFEKEKKVSKYSFGSIYERRIEDIYESSDYQNFKMRVFNNRYPSCLDCDLVDGCDIVKTSDYDCYTNKPSCADCLWSRKIAICP